MHLTSFFLTQIYLSTSSIDLLNTALAVVTWLSLIYLNNYRKLLIGRLAEINASTIADLFLIDIHLDNRN